MNNQRPRSMPTTKFVPWWNILWHIPNFVRLYWRLLLDGRIPLLPKMILIAAVISALLYIIIPFDTMPDLVLPAVGYLDDLLVATLLLLPALKLFIRLCPSDVVREHVERIDRGQ